jgi:ribosomal protein S1
LAELAAKNYLEGVKPGVLYAFSNKNNTAIKIVKVNQDKSMTLLKLKRNEPYPWPEYHKKGEEGYTVELNGEKKKEFLKIIGCPNDL